MATTKTTTTTKSTAATTTTVLVPMQLSAFVLNEAVCSKDLDVKIAPVSQPNYTFLRLSNNLVQPDILDRHDLTDTSPATVNSRVYDLSQNPGIARRNRLGIHLHWSLPRVYRSGTAPSPADEEEQSKSEAPNYPLVPNRFLVIRRLTKDSIPAELATGTDLKLVDAWVVESNRIRHIEEFGPDVDIEVEAAPFIEPAQTTVGDPWAIEGQAGVFLGSKTRFSDWKADQARNNTTIDLTMLTSSNPLFGDYTPHNYNVFSIVDPFQYTRKDGSIDYLSKASADYYVVGWHTNPANDVLIKTQGTTTQRHQETLSTCFMQLKETGMEQWLESTDPLRILCHSAMYGVNFDLSKAPGTLVGHDAGSAISTKQPIAIGSSPLDAILAYCRVHKADPVSKDDVAATEMHDLEEDVTKLQTLLTAHSDDVDSQIAAVDMLSTQSFSNLEGGKVWKFKQTSNEAKPSAPTDAQNIRIDKLNRLQAALDVAMREARSLQWKIFAFWWCIVSSRFQRRKEQSDKFKATIKKVSDRLFTLNAFETDKPSLIRELKAAIEETKAGDASTGVLPVTECPADRFHMRKEPTLLFGGIKSPWQNYLDDLLVRTDTQLVTSSPADPEWDTSYTDTFVKTLSQGLDLGPNGKDDFDIRDTFEKLLKEFKHLRPGIYSSSADLPQGTVMSSFRDDTAINESRGRDRWQNRQPWFPLFVEWEAVYSHVPFERWSFVDDVPRRYDGMPQTRYKIDGDFRQKPILQNDQRLVSGRVLILPQSSFSLSANVRQVLDNTDPQTLTDAKITDSDKGLMLRKIQNLEFLSAPISGLTAHLLTLNQGTHLKPTVRVPGGAPKAIAAAVDAARGAFPDGMADTLIGIVDAETGMTPYGNLYDFTGIDTLPMKPATHGQLMFTSINIIDRFGQAISAIPTKRIRYTETYDMRASIYPCVGDALAVDPVSSPAHPNTVIPEVDGDACRSVNLTPAINQSSRINAAFVVPDSLTGQWRPSKDWENPVWGWLLVNYADYGLQFFTKDGVFYREIRMGGRGGATADRKWLPFAPPPNADVLSQTDKDVAQLDYLIAKIMDKKDTNRVYLQALFDMMNQSIEEASPHAPPEYAQFLPSAIGKPFALVNAGWSLELAQDENLNWSTLSGTTSDAVFPDNTFDQRHDEPFLLPTPSKSQPGQQARQYTFPMKLGDKYRWFDGLVGCFAANPAGTAQPVSNLLLDTLFTYFTKSSMPAPAKPGALQDPRTFLSSSVVKPLSPFFIPAASDAVAFGDKRNTKLSVYGLIMDPFLPVHVYTEILPISTLKLPPWTLQSAMERMTAFFHMGPLVVTTDVPDYNPSKQLNSATYRIKDDNSAVVPDIRVDLPVVGIANWNWLQPYLSPYPPDPRLPVKAVDDNNNPIPPPPSPQTFFNAFKLDQRSNQGAAGGHEPTARMPKGPYSAVEGFLQLVEPVVVDTTSTAPDGLPLPKLRQV